MQSSSCGFPGDARLLRVGLAYPQEYRHLCTAITCYSRLIESKRELAKNLIEGEAELDLTSLSDRELLRLVSLDLGSAAQE